MSAETASGSYPLESVATMARIIDAAETVKLADLLKWVKFSLHATVVFFQAEGGIRDWSVTGVQTCALPISLDGPRQKRRGHARAPRDSRLGPRGSDARVGWWCGVRRSGSRSGPPCDRRQVPAGERGPRRGGGVRSADRRASRADRARSAALAPS